MAPEGENLYSGFSSDTGQTFLAQIAFNAWLIPNGARSTWFFEGRMAIKSLKMYKEISTPH
jgi:hypothetical protein